MNNPTTPTKPGSMAADDNILPQSGQHWMILGQVQGVGYRQAMCRQAVQFGLTGWCANRPEGSVEAEVYGSDAQINALYQWCLSGPEMAQVSKILTESTPTIDAPADFTIRR